MRIQRKERSKKAFSKGQWWIHLKAPLICMALILCDLMADAVMVGGGSGGGGGASRVLFLFFFFLSVSYLGLLSLSFNLKSGFVVFFLFDLNLRFNFGVFGVV